MIEPYMTDGDVTLYHGKMEEVIPALGLTADLVLADSPYGETSLIWDRWPDGWPAITAAATNSMWCFGSLRLFAERWQSFVDAGWNYSHEIVWEKHNGSGFTNDRFKRVHEFAVHWYQGRWSAQHRAVPRVPALDPTDRRTRTRKASLVAPHRADIGGDSTFTQDGTRLMRSVIRVPSMKGHAIHPTEKPVGILVPLIEYACPPGGVVLDPFAGSGSTGEACRLSGRRAVLIEGHEPYCEAIARRLSQRDLFADLLGDAS